MMNQVAVCEYEGRLILKQTPMRVVILGCLIGAVVLALIFLTRFFMGHKITFMEIVPSIVVFFVFMMSTVTKTVVIYPTLKTVFFESNFCGFVWKRAKPYEAIDDVQCIQHKAVKGSSYTVELIGREQIRLCSVYQDEADQVVKIVRQFLFDTPANS